MRILVIDDAPALRTLFAQLAHALGHEVTEAHDSSSALRAVQDRLPDAIVVDGRLPPDGALAALAQVRAAAPSAEVYVIAALDERELVRSALAAGAAGVVLRPFVASQVAAAFAGRR